MMSDNSDDSVSPIIHKGKRKATILTDSDVESDSSVSDVDVALFKRNGKRKNRIHESDSDSSIEKARKIKRIPRVTSDSESVSDDGSDIVKVKKSARVVSDSSNSDSDSESGVSDNGFEDVEDNTSDEWESDWISESEIDNSRSLQENNTTREPVASSSHTAGHLSDSSDGESEKCPICLLSFNNQEVGTPETCDHNFCADCIQEWSRNVNTCPVDRQTFTLILVRKHFNGKVIRTVPVDVRRPSVDELIQEDPTYCEICGMSDREDRLLLCDGCDLGYHLECLDPPLDRVPIEEWFCTDCQTANFLNDDQSDQPHRRYRTEHRLLPRTRQSERVRATIETNRHNYTINIDQQSLSSGFEDVAVPGPSQSSTNHRSRSMHTKVYKRKKTRKTKTKRTSYTVTYEICDITGEKIAIKKKKKRKYKTRKIKKVYRRKRKNRRVVKPKTVKKRLAYQLGMCPPKKAGLAIPEVKIKSNTSNIGHIGLQRSQAGIPTLHLFGQRDQLDYFSESDEDFPVNGSGDVLSQIRTVSSGAGALRRVARRKAAVLAPISPIEPCDILGSILDSQTRLHSKNSVISVRRDGTLHIEESNPHKTEKNNNIESESNIFSQNPPLDVTSNAEVEIIQAPMFPGRGAGGNRQPHNFYRGGYRGGENRYDGGSGGGYNHFQGGGPRGRGYGQNMFSPRDNNFGYMNYHHHSGPPPFRGRGPPRFPIRRPQLHQQQPAVVCQQEEPVELNLDEPMEQNVDQSRQQDEDVDIYSDIESSTPVPDEEIPEQKISESESTLVAQVYNNSGSDDDSGSELIIDDSVKEADKYDPTQPSADTDSNSEPPLNLKNIEQQKDSNLPDEQTPEVPEQLKEVESPKLTTFSTQVVKEAVQQVIKEHLTTPTSSKINDNNDDDDDDDQIDDEDCPNFSIYSSTSIDIAKSTDISVDIPKDTEDLQEEDMNFEREAIIDLNVLQCDAKSKDDSWESGDEWDNCESEDKNEKNELVDKNDEVVETLEKDNVEVTAENDTSNEVESIEEKLLNDDVNEEEKLEMEEQISDLKETSENIEKSEFETSCRTPTNNEKSPTNNDKSPTNNDKSPTNNDKSPTNNDKSPTNPLLVEVEKLSERDSITPPLPSVPVPEENVQEKAIVIAPIKIAFQPGKKYQPINKKKEKILQLYDDSDWEEWEAKNEIEKSVKPATENVSELDKMTEAISEEERSYTPCLDEREPVKNQFSDEERNVGSGIGGMDTELISDEERNDIFDESHDMKTISDGDALEINAKESELDMTRPEDYEEGEIIEKLAAKKTQENQVDKLKQNVEDDRKKRSKKKSEKEIEKDKAKESDKQPNKPEFKKFSKSTKERNYRDKDKARSKSPEKKGKENKENKRDDKKKKERKRDLERYNVRSIIAEKPKRDQFGRDIKSPSRSSRSLTPRRSRSHSWNRNKRRRRRSRSVRRSHSRSVSRGYTSRSRSRGKTPRRSRSIRRSRSPRRSNSKSFRRSRSPRGKRHRLEYRSTSRDRERLRYRNRSRKRSTERIRTKKKKRSTSRARLRSQSVSPSKYRIRSEWGRNIEANRRQSFTRDWTPSWSRSPTPPRPVPRHNLPQSMSPSWTPPLAIEKGPVQPEHLTVILTNNEVSKSKKKEKRKKSDKKSRDEYRKRKRSDRTPPPSKEVFASGDNILVSVSFNKTAEETAIATREVTGVKRRKEDAVKKKKEKLGEKKKKRAKSPRTKKKNKEIANMKPVAIIDLDRSPFKELTPSPKDIIVLSDSDNCEKEDEAMSHHNMLQEELMALDAQIQEDSAPQSPTANYLNSTGPKTPPEPQIKFLLSSKQTQLRAINNPLHDPNDEPEGEIDPQEELEHRLDDMLHKGPNTPPEPPSSPPSSPDAYDPFDPTKSRSPTPDVPIVSQPPSSVMNTPGDKTEFDGDLVDLAVGPLESSQKSSVSEPGEKCSNLLDRTKRLSLSPEIISQTLTPPINTSEQPSESAESKKTDSTDKSSKSPERNNIGVIINQQVQPQFPAVVKPIISTSSINTSTSTNPTISRTNLFNTQTLVSGTPRIASSVPQRIILPTPAKSSPAKMSPLKTSPSKPPIKSTPIKPMPSSKTMISKLPVPNMKPITPVRKSSQSKVANRNVGQNGNEIIEVDMDFESPYSPGSSDYEDLFEPPAESTKNSRGQTKNTTKSPAKLNAFDSLFGSSPVYRQQNNKTKQKTNAAKIPVKMNKKPTPTKERCINEMNLVVAGSKTIGVKIDEDNLKILDDLPNSAVEMQVKDKFLKKLNRQERVVEEVKLVLKPHYNKKHVTKEQYKDILRRAVPKICHNRSGEINPKKIQNLIEAYVRKVRHSKKTSGGGTTGNAVTTAVQQKSTKAFWS